MKQLLTALCLLFVPLFAFGQPASPRLSRCAATLLPQFDVPRLQVSFEIPSPENLPKEAWRFKLKSASCSGVDCGCDIDQQECNAGCDPNSENYYGCLAQCAHQYHRCAVCCCCDPSQWCPSYC